PWRVSRTRPTRSSECRCRVMAWRVMPLPSLSRVIESGPSTDRRRTRARRVVSPRAANTGAACRAAPPRLPDIRRQLPALAVPPRLVHPERLGPARARQPVEARLGNRDGGPAGGLLQPELHQGGRLSRVVHLRVDRIRVPAIGEVALGFDPLDQDL